MMFNPSRQVAISLVLAAFVCLVLGLATDVGLFGWSIALVLVLYLCVAGVARIARRRSATAAR